MIMWSIFVMNVLPFKQISETCNEHQLNISIQNKKSIMGPYFIFHVLILFFYREIECVKISLISYSFFLLLLFFICILGLAHMFFIINTDPICIFYTRKINLNPYFLYIQYGI